MTISKKSMKWIPWLLVLPVVIIRGFTTLYPILMTVRNSFFDIKILSGINEFCGIQNYLKIFSDPKVLTSIRFTVIFVVVSMIFHVILGVGLALILNMKFKGRRFLRTIVLLSLIHISEPTRRTPISYAVFCLKKKKQQKQKTKNKNQKL